MAEAQAMPVATANEALRIENMVAETRDETWTDHSGGPCPIPSDRKVVVRYRNGVQSPQITARERRWGAWPSDIGNTDWDIVAWRLSSS